MVTATSSVTSNASPADGGDAQAGALTAKDQALVAQASTLLATAYDSEESWQKRMTSIESLTRVAELGKRVAPSSTLGDCSN